MQSLLFIQLTVIMAIISSLLLGHNKCLRLYQNDESFCIYGVDIALCVVIILLLVPQIVVVRVTSCLFCSHH